ncbi:MAG: bactofilin family protein [Saccharofermentanales bacterium]
MNLKRHLAEFTASNDSDKIDTVIGSTVIIDGPVTTRRAIRIDGTVHGGVTTRANLFTGPDSVINGDVVGRNMTLCGVVNGNVRASGRVIITSKAKISGDLSMQHLVVDEGALFNGSITMTTSTDMQDVSPVKE